MSVCARHKTICTVLVSGNRAKLLNSRSRINIGSRSCSHRFTFSDGFMEICKLWSIDVILDLTVATIVWPLVPFCRRVCAIKAMFGLPKAVRSCVSDVVGFASYILFIYPLFTDSKYFRRLC